MTQRSFILTAGLLITTSTVLSVIAVVPQFREKFREHFVDTQRLVLAKASADLNGSHENMVIIKVKSADTLSLEAYGEMPGQKDLVFRSRIILNEKRDAYFTYRGRAANLVLSDVDNDGKMEILAPAYDENLIPRLNIYKYNDGTQSLVRMDSQSLKL